MSEPVADGDVPPRTNDAEIDTALRALTDLPTLPLSEHHDRLASVHEVLHRALDRADELDAG
jgi:hypothetical protein